MEKICQNIIENEFRFMTLINYICSKKKKKNTYIKGKSLFSAKDISLPPLALCGECCFFSMEIYQIFSFLFFLLQVCGILLSRISFTNILCIMCIAFVSFGIISLFFRNEIYICIHTYISCNVACNDGTFVGLLIFEYHEDFVEFFFF